jgi:hypothetical protein
MSAKKKQNMTFASYKYFMVPRGYYYTDKKENKSFLIYKEIHMGAVAKSYMRKGFLMYEKMRKNLVIYEEAESHI